MAGSGWASDPWPAASRAARAAAAPAPAAAAPNERAPKSWRSRETLDLSARGRRGARRSETPLAPRPVASPVPRQRRGLRAPLMKTEFLLNDIHWGICALYIDTCEFRSEVNGVLKTGYGLVESLLTQEQKTSVGREKNGKLLVDESAFVKRDCHTDKTESPLLNPLIKSLKHHCNQWG